MICSCCPRKCNKPRGSGFCRIPEGVSGSDWYKGTANAIYQNINFIERYDPEYVIILSGDQICKQDYNDFLQFHKEKGAEFSVAVMEVPWEEASRFGLNGHQRELSLFGLCS